MTTDEIALQNVAAFMALGLCHSDLPEYAKDDVALSFRYLAAKAGYTQEQIVRVIEDAKRTMKREEN